MEANKFTFGPVLHDIFVMESLLMKDIREIFIEPLKHKRTCFFFITLKQTKHLYKAKVKSPLRLNEKKCPYVTWLWRWWAWRQEISKFERVISIPNLSINFAAAFIWKNMHLQYATLVRAQVIAKCKLQPSVPLYAAWLPVEKLKLTITNSKWQK